MPVDQVEPVLSLYRERYAGFTAQHFHDKLCQHHGFRLGYTWIKLRLQAAGLLAKAPRRGAHRKKRPRRPLRGMLLHQDGSPHRWLPALDAPLDLIVTQDDVTSELYSAFLVEEEGTSSSFRALAEVIVAHGLPCALYTDRASHYFHTPKAGAKVAKDQPTQVGRALAQLGIEHIPAYSPKPAAAPSAPSARCRTACPRSSRSPAVNRRWNGTPDRRAIGTPLAELGGAGRPRSPSGRARAPGASAPRARWRADGAGGTCGPPGSASGGLRGGLSCGS